MYNDSKLILLTEEQLKNNQLEVFEKYGFRAAMTDLAVLRGLQYSDEDLNKRVPDNNSLKGRVGTALIQQPDGLSGYYMVVRDKNEFLLNDINMRGGGIRPVLKLSSLEFEQVSKNKQLGYNGSFEVEYGEYPQYVPNEGMQKTLSDEKHVGNLKKNGKSYTFDSARFLDKNVEFSPVNYDEYEYEGKRYIYVDANIFGYDSCQLSDSKNYVSNSSVWLEVSPVKWLVDEKTGLLVSKKILLSGIRYCDVKKFLDNYMLKDLFQTNKLVKVNDADLEDKSSLGNIEDEQKEKLVDLLRSLKESGLELTEEQEKIVNFVDNRELREKRQREIRDNIVLENQRKEEWFNSPDNPSNIRLEQLKKLRTQVEILKKIQQKNPVLLSSEQKELIEYLDMVDLADLMPHEIDTGMEPEIRNWYNERYSSESENVKTR